MRKIIFTFLTVFMVSTAAVNHVMAKSSSGGGAPVEASPEAFAPPSVSDQPIADPMVSPVKPLSNDEEFPKVAAPLPPEPVLPDNSLPEEKKIAAPQPEEMIVCSKLEHLRERIKCRVEKTEEELQIELTNENYFPEGCRWGTEEWQSKCKERYRAIHPLYSLPIGQERMKALKQALDLPEKLVKPSVFCEAKEADCEQTYKENVIHLIVARFYDLEERAEELHAQKKISDDQLIDIVVKISEAKVAFYEAKNDADPNRARFEIINSLQTDWKTLVKDL